jgi:Glycosyl hydrolase family 12.
MRIKLTRRRSLLAGTAVVAAAGAALLVPLPFAHAAEIPLDADAATDAQRYQTRPVVSPEGQFNVATNLWNPAVTGGFDFIYDDAASRFRVTNYTANSYFGPGGEPGCTVGADAEDPDCAWVGSGDPWATAANPTVRDQFGYRANGYTTVSTDPYRPADVAAHNYAGDAQFGLQIHAPASYPSIIAGCHWGECSGGTANGAPFPLQATGIARMESIWTINTAPPAQAGPNEAWDAAYDIWFDTNARGVLPATPASLNNPGQNDGAEIMIWVNNRGYNNATPGVPYEEGTIRPAGKLLAADVTIPGIQNTNADGSPLPTTFDVWGGRVRSWDNGIRWNVISFVARNRGYGLIGTTPQPWGGFDAHAFIKYAAYDLHEAGLTCDTELPVTASPTSTDIERTRCLDPTWWLTSVQAGFEIWNLPSTATLATTKFAANPVAVSGGVNTGGRAVPPGVPGVAPGTPLVFWGDEFSIQAAGCPNATNVSWSIDAQNYAPWTEPPFTEQGDHVAIGWPLAFVPNPNPAGVKPVSFLDVQLMESPPGPVTTSPPGPDRCGTTRPTSCTVRRR